MEVKPVPEASFNPEDLSDWELIQLLPAKERKDQTREESDLTAQQKKGLDELWRRHCGTVEQCLRAKIFARGSTLCPFQEPDKEHFLLLCLNEAYPAFLRRTWREEYGNFGAFLYTLAFHTLLDIRKAVIRKSQKEEQYKMEYNEEGHGVRTTDIPGLLAHGANPERIAAASEAKRIIVSVLHEHAQESPRNALSTKVLRRRWIDECSWREITETLPELIGPTLGARIKKTRDFEKANRLDVLRRVQELGIRDARTSGVEDKTNPRQG